MIAKARESTAAILITELKSSGCRLNQSVSGSNKANRGEWCDSNDNENKNNTPSLVLKSTSEGERI
jgi:hypothetical protein